MHVKLFFFPSLSNSPRQIRLGRFQRVERVEREGGMDARRADELDLGWDRLSYSVLHVPTSAFPPQLLKRVDIVVTSLGWAKHTLETGVTPNASAAQSARKPTPNQPPTTPTQPPAMASGMHPMLSLLWETTCAIMCVIRPPTKREREEERRKNTSNSFYHPLLPSHHATKSFACCHHHQTDIYAGYCESNHAYTISSTLSLLLIKSTFSMT